ncbi:Pc16g13420 [Penicillium rubens Wisconsin 54-1255]|uniref:Pc16g13420 protein n=1 Tax=Penicillium rubens (strain ATCC 28089 / DSM 1075 / NRRL 1951 / Wisconsin 54-1255) TaxID=500485 RepID=B6HAN3_PENRW|nr:Pc16g13420 [Penicillium rubens Wisconsin 54-1255]
MKEHNITADAAKMILLGVIVEQESLAAKLKKERLEKPTSKEILQYFEAIELYVGGSCYWHSTAPRYQMERNPKPGRQMGTQNTNSTGVYMECKDAIRIFVD